MSGSRFVVRRRNWRWAPGNEHTPRGWVCFPGPGAEVAGFESLDAAEADRAQREAAVRLKMNPFECGPLSAVSTLPDPILRDFLMDAGVEPPAAGVAWADWWTATRSTDQPGMWHRLVASIRPRLGPAMSDEHQARVWQAADKVRFFEVTEEPDAPQIHVVVSVDWEERGGVHVAEWDGGEPIRAFRHLRRAGEAVRDWANNHRITLAGQHAVDAAPFADCRPSHVPDPFAPGSTRLLRLPRASFWEVVTVPFDEAGDTMTDLGERVSVVVRRDYASGPNGFWTGSSAACVPLKAFADWDNARECALQFERAARAWFNPFLIAEGTRGRRHPHRPEELMDALRLPAPRDGDWCGWWQEFVAPLPEDQRRFAWDQLGVRIYGVVSVPFEAAQ